MNIACIGYGNMAKAIVASLDTAQYTIRCASPSITPKTENGIHLLQDNVQAVIDADVVMLCVKPQNVAHVLKGIAPHVRPNALVISIAAGISLETLAHFSPPQQAIVRCMPNTPIAVGKGAVPLAANAYVSTAQKQMAQAIFEPSSLTVWLENESCLDAYTALSGSGPAYVFLLAEAMIEAAIHLGIEPHPARAFALQTLSGAAAMMQSSPLSPEQLREKVTSPAGTTAAALDIMQQHHLKETVLKAMQAACERAKALGSPSS